MLQVCAHTHDAAARKVDPTGTTQLRAAYESHLVKRFRRVRALTRSALVDLDILGMKPKAVEQRVQSAMFRHIYSTKDVKDGQFIQNPETGLFEGSEPGPGHGHGEGGEGKTGSGGTTFSSTTEFYHGTAGGFNEFDLAKLHSGQDKGGESWYGHGIYLSGEPWKGAAYAHAVEGGQVYTVTTTVSNSFVVHGTAASDLTDALRGAGLDSSLKGGALTDTLRGRGYDSVVVLKSGSKVVNELVVFNASNIKITEKTPVASFNVKAKAKAILDSRAFDQTPPRRNFQHMEPADRLTAFNGWFHEIMQEEILGIVPGTQSNIAGRDTWQWRYLRHAWDKGSRDAESRVQQKGLTDAPRKKSPEQIVRQARADLIKQRSFAELEGITDEMSKQISRILAEGIQKGQGALVVAKNISRAIDTIGIVRARTIARTELIGAYAESALQQYEEAGILGVQTEAEFSTAGDDQVCPICAGMEGQIFTLQEARGVIPVHPNCRCAWLPVV